MQLAASASRKPERDDADVVETMNSEEFEAFWEIYAQAFPECEKRDRAGQMRVLARREYRVERMVEHGVLLGFVACWDIGGYWFVEHVAVADAARGRGLGSELMKKMTGRDKPVILEVEPPADDIARRRVGFYQRLGFHLNAYPHIQPPLQPGGQSVRLLLMSYPEPLTAADAETVQARLRQVVYSPSF